MARRLFLCRTARSVGLPLRAEYSDGQKLWRAGAYYSMWCDVAEPITAVSFALYAFEDNAGLLAGAFLVTHLLRKTTD